MRELEKREIGQPSTYAATLKTLALREYVVARRRDLLATENGCSVVDWLWRAFPELLDYGCMARLEEQLDRIAAGGADWRRLLAVSESELRKRLSVADCGGRVGTRCRDGSGFGAPSEPASRFDTVPIAMRGWDLAFVFLETGAVTFAEVVHKWSEKWNEPLKVALRPGWRRFFAGSGTVPWIVYNTFRSEELWSTFEVLDRAFVPGATLLGMLVFQALLAGWFVWLIAYQERKCSPTRLFLEGLLLPALAAGLLMEGVPFFSGGAS